jgi:hypothetical protein
LSYLITTNHNSEGEGEREGEGGRGREREREGEGGRGRGRERVVLLYNVVFQPASSDAWLFKLKYYVGI